MIFARHTVCRRFGAGWKAHQDPTKGHKLHEIIALNGTDNLFQVFPFRLVAFGGLADRTVALSPVRVCDAVGFELLVQEIQCPIFLQVLLQAGCILERSRLMVCFSLFIHHACT